MVEEGKERYSRKQLYTVRCSMKIEVGRFKDGRLMVKVVFEPDSNFRKETLSWVPTFDEVELITETLNSIDTYNTKGKKLPD
jgi:hypothetical protein